MKLRLRPSTTPEIPEYRSVSPRVFTLGSIAMRADSELSANYAGEGDDIDFAEKIRNRKRRESDARIDSQGIEGFRIIHSAEAHVPSYEGIPIENLPRPAQSQV